jgi:putative hydrolase of the HAD superfamily
VEYYYAHLRAFVEPGKEQLEVVQALRAMGIKNAIVTNITPELLVSQKAKVKALNIAHLFDAIIYSAELGIHKPDRRIFDHAAQLLGVSNDQCVFVGDDPASDVIGARNAEMEVVWLDRFAYNGSFADDPGVHRVHSVKEYFDI